MNEEIRNIGSEQIPYFRTEEFSMLMKENEALIKQFFGATDASRVVFLTGSGTASMEASVMNVLNENDKAIVVNGGGFGARFTKLCEIHKVPHTEIAVPAGKKLTKEMLSEYENKGYTAFLVNVHETSTGVLYDIEAISEFCKRNNLLLIVDAISSFLADKLNMHQLGINVMITGSQKALALPPGISIIALDETAIKRVENNQVKSMYFDISDYLKNGERGQTPFTPAVSVLIQMNKRLKQIENDGLQAEQDRIAAIAKDFREKIKELPFDFFSESMSNAVTSLTHKNGVSAREIFEILKDEYNIWVCPNGGELAEKVFRVGHIGALTSEDNDALIDALKDMQRRNLI